MGKQYQDYQAIYINALYYWENISKKQQAKCFHHAALFEVHQQHQVFEYFGTAGRAMFTMFELTLAKLGRFEIQWLYHGEAPLGPYDI